MRSRVTSIESFRTLAIFGVILWHSDFLPRLQRIGEGHLVVDVTLYMIWWVSLPYFFIVAGYFFGKSVGTHGNPIAYLRRYVSSLGWIFFAWFCVYMVVPINWPAEVRDHGLWQPFYSEALKNLDVLKNRHIGLFLNGGLPTWHLWFLPALMASLIALTVLTVYRLQTYALPLIIGLYLIALSEEARTSNSLDPSIHFGLWSIAVLFSVLGWWVAQRGQPSVSTALFLIIGGYAFALMEGAAIRAFFQSSGSAMLHHYYLGGVALALGIFLLALAKPNWGQSTLLPFLAQYTLGVYLSHILIMYSLIPISWRLQSQLPLLQLVFSFAVYFLAVLFTITLARIPATMFLVTRTASVNRTILTVDYVRPSSFRYRPSSYQVTRMIDQLVDRILENLTPVTRTDPRLHVESFIEAFRFRRAQSHGSHHL